MLWGGDMNFILLSTVIAAIAEAFTQGMSEEEIGFWAAVFTQLGDSMATLLAQKAVEDQDNS